ncbi:hypothetical protein COW81_03045 [Candidatus Campbellbacteria bacterium CG22_combo_CG10-13_8_21_14_all_36_13]|uniref:RNHCP domain-containing protein n=1 Tax=Candidatus Campbellbacteria bacterium CG22_combo_CG10-13_8_21_14_all_36_13 TaxID=1974529 RepID=A0A2H0DYZ0_9BACT|nr:MAG: hypothetical protein COW81_03045 [Candidatus Campbellbacteria bacterium CG22_combo_CG10-13_8_21_14_all_36_13]
METKKFTRNIENFVCENCGIGVDGDGFTNHCPKCLWSKHVDINPGDRGAICLGMMKPISVITKGTEYILVHKCIKCGHEKKNKTTPEDNFEILLTL